MAKLCIYCGQPLLKDDAQQICMNCGRSQLSPSSSAAASSAIKVKLPPKEFPLADGVPAAWQAQGMFEAEPASEATNLSQREGQPPSRLPKRPVRLKTAEAQTNIGQPQIEAAFPPFASAAPQGETTVPLESDEQSSTMVLPGWQEELALLRQELSANSTIVPEKPAKPFHQAAPVSPLQSFQNAPLAVPELPDILKQEQQHFSAFPEPPAPLTGSSSEEKMRRELHVKVWEQEQKAQNLQIKAEKENKAPPALPPKAPPVLPPVEHPPLAQNDFENFVSEEIDPEQQISEMETIRWHAVGGPTSIEEKYERVRQKLEGGERTEELFEGIEGEGEQDVEDLPTAPIAVPEALNHIPQITIERASTPAPWSKASSIGEPEDLENLTTKPMAASPIQAGPRSPMPPTAPGQGIERPQPPQWVSSSAPSSAPFTQPPRESGSNPQQPLGIPYNANGPVGQQAFAPSAWPGNFPPNPQAGSSLNPNSRVGSLMNQQALSENTMNPNMAAGNAFNMSAMPALPFNPPSQSGNPLQQPEGPEGQMAPEAHPSSGPRPPINTPQPELSAVSAALAHQHKKRRSGRVLAIVIIMLLLVGASSWYVINYQPFTNPLSHPYQAYQSASFGFALDYPEKWVVTTDPARGVVHFADTSHTGQVDLSITPSSGQTLEQYLSAIVDQEGITGQSTAPRVSFAGATWEQLHGTVTQSGATYTIVVYTAQHNDRYYALAMMAPPTVYEQMEQDNFTHLRNSFLFL